MGVVLRQSIKGTLSNYIGVVLGAFTMLILFPKLLEPDQIGLIRVLQDIGILIASLSQIGIVNIIDRYYPYFHEDKTRNNGFVLLMICYPLVGFILIMGILVLFKGVWLDIYSEKSPLLTHYFIILIPLAFFMLYQQILEAYTRAVMRITVPMFVREVFLRFAMIVFTILYATGLLGFDGFVYSLILSYCLAVIILIFYLRRLKRLWFEFLEISRHKILLKEILKYGGVIFLTSFVAVLSARIDIVMLSTVSLEMTGVYSIAFFMGTVIEMPKRAISQISIPFISSGWKNNNLDSIGEIYKRTSLAQTLIGGLLFTLLIVNIKDVFNLIPNSDIYVSGIFVVFLIGLSRLIDMATGLNAEIIISSPFYRVNFFLTIFLGVSNIVFNSLLIPRYGMNGAALGTLISFTLSNCVRMAIIWQKTGLFPFVRETGSIIVLSASLLLLFYFWDINGTSLESSLLIIAAKSLFVLLVFMGVSYKFNFSPDLSQFIDQLFKKK